MPQVFVPPADHDFVEKVGEVLARPGVRLARWKRVADLVYYAGLLGALGWLFSQAIDRSPPTTYNAVTLRSPQVRAGEEVKVYFDYFRHKVCEVEVSWSIRDGAGETRRFGPKHYDATGRVGQEPPYTSGFWVPTNAAPGRATLRIIIAWQCPGNYIMALYPVTVALPDMEFNILPAAAP